MELKFKIGENFDENTPDGREVSAIVTQEGDKFISVQTAKKVYSKKNSRRKFRTERVEFIILRIGLRSFFRRLPYIRCGTS
jgi:hypothetical protein